MWVFWVPDGDVARHAFGVVFAGEDAEGASHVCEEVGAVGGEGWEGGDAGEGLAAGDCFEGGGFLFVFGLGIEGCEGGFWLGF